MVNINKLKGKIVERELTVEKLAEKLKLDRSTIYRKIAGQGLTFTIKEANQICEILGLTGAEAIEIFFNQYVARNANSSKPITNFDQA